MGEERRRTAVGEPTHRDQAPDSEGEFAAEHDDTDLVDRDRRLRDEPDEPESPRRPGGMDL